MYSEDVFIFRAKKKQSTTWPFERNVEKKTPY